MTFKIKDNITETSRVKVETDKGITKHYELVDDEFSLVTVEDENGYTEVESIPNFSKYKVDLKGGRVFSEVSSKWLNPRANQRFGYVYTSLRNDNGLAIPISLHQVVMSSYLQQTPEQWKPLTINHIDFDKENNSIYNLELIEHKDQFCDEVRNRMGKGQRLNNDDVRYLRLMKAILEAKGEYAQNDFCNYYSEKMNRTYTTIENIANDRTYSEIQLSKKELEMINKVRMEYDLRKFGVDLAV